MASRNHALLVAVALLAGCDAVSRQNTDPAGGGAATDTARADACSRCHGSAGNPAPPMSVRGETSPTAVSVGAHEAHLRGGRLNRPVACEECHVVPTDTAHADGVVKVTFGPLAAADGAPTAWDRGSATCATYCHGATLAGGSNVAPVWTRGAGEAACGACHGLPPPAPHAASADCGACHVGYTATSVDVSKHVDGRVQIGNGAEGACGSCHSIPPPPPHAASSACGNCHPGYTSTSVVDATHPDGQVNLALGCTSCHGDAARTGAPTEAPPSDTRGSSDPAARGVGAHQAHPRTARSRARPRAASATSSRPLRSTPTAASA
jgi:predicted CxxxxCH...CXXCH cytochrome family protein